MVRPEINDMYIHMYLSFDDFAITLVNKINGSEWILIIEISRQQVYRLQRGTFRMISEKLKRKRGKEIGSDIKKGFSYLIF